jgi:hypothetical protein
MPRNRRVKYFHKFIVEYIDIIWASCPGIRGLNISINLLWNILKYYGLHAQV